MRKMIDLCTCNARPTRFGRTLHNVVIALGVAVAFAMSGAAFAQCPDGQIEDCCGNCAPATWLGDNDCDAGQWSFNGNPIFFNCFELNCDEGDCTMNCDTAENVCAGVEPGLGCEGSCGAQSPDGCWCDASCPGFTDCCPNFCDHCADIDPAFCGSDPGPGPGDSNCCAAHDGVGCDDAACEAAVCTEDPFCCEVEWDSLCATLAEDCDVCQAAPGGECAGHCGGQSPSGCWCDDGCFGFSDCCPGVCDDCPTLGGCNGGDPGNGCAGFCGGQSPSGCWCDDGCFGFSDCCPGVCDDCPALGGCFEPEPCDPADIPANNDCANADFAPAPLGGGDSHTYSGNNLCATHDCASFPSGEGHVWIAFELLQDSAVQLSYCGSTNLSGGAFGNAWLNLAIGCPCSDFTGGASFAFSCADGNVEMTWGNLPAGTYYYPVMLDGGLGAAGDYNITVTVLGDVIGCEGFCGAQSPAGCWCDSSCPGFSDCCPDFCDHCEEIDPAFCGGTPGSNCCEAHGGLGCDDADCEALICAQDAFCCDVQWDGLCAGAANDQCAVCDTPVGGDCAGFCGGQAPSGCWCDNSCMAFSDCCAGVCDDCPDITGCGPAVGCDGFCGGQSPDGCWCDASCPGFSDCCEDFCDHCAELDADGILCDDVEPGDPEGCSIGFWKNNTDVWSGYSPDDSFCDVFGGGTAPGDGPCAGHCGGQHPDGCWCDSSCITFSDCCDPDTICIDCPDLANCGGAAGDRSDCPFGDATLLDVISSPSGGPNSASGSTHANNLGKQAVAALLNAASGANYPLTEDEVKDAVADAIGAWAAGAHHSVLTSLQGELDGYNNLGCPEFAQADLNQDLYVNVFDMLEVLSDWGQSGVRADINRDGVVDVFDLLEVLTAWGPAPIEWQPGPARE